MRPNACGWKWVTDEPFSYTNWKEGEPNNQNNEETCIHLYTGMAWNDLPDGDTSFHSGYYCEWETDTETYDFYGVYGGEVDDETARLVEEGKGFYYGTGEEGYDKSRAQQCFRTAVDGSSGEAWYYLGKVFSEDPDATETLYLRAFGAFQRAVVYGFQLGWAGQGDLYRKGLGVKPDYEKAMQLYQRAVDLGCIEGYHGMALLYDYGQGVELNYGQALELWKLSEQSGDFGIRNCSRNDISLLYLNGWVGEAPDYEQALEYFLQSAESGYADAMYNAGWMYEYGCGTAQDFGMARMWYEKLLSSETASQELKDTASEELAWMNSQE